MLVLLAVLTLAHAADPAPAPAPAATLTWRHGLARVSVDTPPGWHVSAESPTHLQIGSVQVTLLGDPARLRVPLAPESTGSASGVSLDLATCSDDGARCQSWTLGALTGPTGARGALTLVAGAPPIGASSPEPTGVADAPSGAPHAGGVRVYDFTAAWCPPCNRLAAELLHDLADAAWRASQPEITRIDADAASSWVLKNQYKVGGYPTLLAVDAEGREVARLVGYPGEDATRAWFAGLGADLPSWKLREVDPLTLSPEAAARAARRLVAADDADTARRFLPRFATLASEDAAVARLALAPTRDDVAWLVAQAKPGAWVVDALVAVPGAWDLLKPLRFNVPATAAADLLSVRADQLDAAEDATTKAAATKAAKTGRTSTLPAAVPTRGDEALHTRLAARWLLEGVRTGDLERDRGILADLAELRARTDDLDAADALLRAAADAAPDDFSWDFLRARLLVEGQRTAAAVEAGERALSRAHDDQRLRAVQPLARALAASGRTPEALAQIDAVLSSTPVPANDVEVRTHRYVKQVRALREELVRGSPAAR